MANTIRVKAAHDNGRVAFFEHNPEHPDGEVFVYGNGETVEAAETAALKQAIRAGRLISTQETPVSRKQTPPTQTRPEGTRVAPQGIKWIGEAGYDAMNVDEAVDYIRGLSETEQAIVIEHERRNKNRSGVLDAFGSD